MAVVGELFGPAVAEVAIHDRAARVPQVAKQHDGAHAQKHPAPGRRAAARHQHVHGPGADHHRREGQGVGVAERLGTVGFGGRHGGGDAKDGDAQGADRQDDPFDPAAQVGVVEARQCIESLGRQDRQRRHGDQKVAVGPAEEAERRQGGCGQRQKRPQVAPRHEHAERGDTRQHQRARAHPQSQHGADEEHADETDVGALAGHARYQHAEQVIGGERGGADEVEVARVAHRVADQSAGGQKLGRHHGDEQAGRRRGGHGRHFQVAVPVFGGAGVVHHRPGAVGHHDQKHVPERAGRARQLAHAQTQGHHGAAAPGRLFGPVVDGEQRPRQPRHAPDQRREHVRGKWVGQKVEHAAGVASRAGIAAPAQERVHANAGQPEVKHGLERHQPLLWPGDGRQHHQAPVDRVQNARLRVGVERVTGAVVGVPQGQLAVAVRVELKLQVAPVLPQRVPAEDLAGAVDARPHSPEQRQHDDAEYDRGDDVRRGRAPAFAPIRHRFDHTLDGRRGAYSAGMIDSSLARKSARRYGFASTPEKPKSVKRSMTSSSV